MGEFCINSKGSSLYSSVYRLRKREEYFNLGKSILERGFQKEGYEFAEKAFEDVLTIFNVETTDDLFVEVGAGHLTGREVIEAVFPGTKKK